MEKWQALKKTFQSGTIEKMVVPVATGFEIIHLASLTYLRAEGSYTALHFADKRQMLVSKNLKHFETVLSDLSFFVRIHRSYIINVNKARKISFKNGHELLLEDGTELPVAAEKVEKIIELLYKV